MNEKACMHDGCDREATRFEQDDLHWHDWIWCDEHAEGRPVEPLSAADVGVEVVS